MKKQYDYFWAQVGTFATGVVFWTQLLLDKLDVVRPDPDFEWFVSAWALAFGASLAYLALLVVLNTARRTKHSPKEGA